jgi:hypothetical protein
VRKTVAISCYFCFVELVALFLIGSPVHAFIVSNTGYVRVASAATGAAYYNANAATISSAIAASATSGSIVSTAVRIVAGPVGWAAIGVVAGTALYQWYYSQTDMQTLYNSSGTQSYQTPSGFVAVSGSKISGCFGPCTAGTTQFYYVPHHTAAQNNQCNGGWYAGPTLPTGWSQTGSGWGTSSWGGDPNTCYDVGSRVSTGTSDPNIFGSVTAPPTPAQVQSYLQGLPASSPLAPANHQQAAGADPSSAGNTNPATNQTTQSATPAQVPTSVVPAGSVGPNDAVVNPNAPAPTGTVTNNTQQQSTTTTTTTTTNPDGSVTQQQTTQATSSCAAGTHDARTMGSVLDDHLQRWKGSSLLATLDTLKNLTWPSTLPTYTLSSSLIGTFSFDFSAWSGTLLALRGILIAFASMVAYRIVFVGSK